MQYRVRNISQLRDVIQKKKDEMLDNGALFIQKRLKDNYESGVPEGVPMEKHSRLTEEIHGKHKMFKITGKGIDSIEIDEELIGNKRRIFTDYDPFKISEEGSTQIVTKAQSGAIFAKSGIFVPVGSVLIQPARPVFKETAKSRFMKKGLIRAMDS